MIHILKMRGLEKKLCCMELTICQENANICSNFVRSVDRHFVLMSVSFLLILVKKNFFEFLKSSTFKGNTCVTHFTHECVKWSVGSTS